MSGMKTRNGLNKKPPNPPSVTDVYVDNQQRKNKYIYVHVNTLYVKFYDQLCLIKS